MKKMMLSGWQAGPTDYEQGLDYYHGKDVVHRGCLLELDPDVSWLKISPKLRNKIRQAEKLGVEIKRVKGTAADISLFRTIWFDPEDVTIPSVLPADDIMYLAYLKGALVGGLILSPSGGNNLYMHNLGSTDDGKQQNIPALLLWHAVRDLAGGKYKYIDVGVSFRPNLYNFFKQWQTDTYPIIFEPPFITPDIRLTPYASRNVPRYDGTSPAPKSKLLESYFGPEFTILPRAILAIRAVLLHLEVKPTQNVAIFKTFDNDFISRCVTAPIESVCKVSRKLGADTAAALVIHEFGHPYSKSRELKEECLKRGIALIEDCAWTYGTHIDDQTKVGQLADYTIYSLPKILPLPYGAVLTGVTISDEDNWNKYRMLDYYKRATVLAQLKELLPKLPEVNERRRANWQDLATKFAQSGFHPFAPLAEGVYPGAFLLQLPNFQDAFDRYERFGVETGRYYHEGALYLPVHQNLGEPELDYIYAVYRGEMNLCLDYHREN
jgi:hypothetical protein